MKLDEYLEEVGIPIALFARRVGVSPSTINNILDGKRDLRLSVAVKIEEETKSKVTCKELLPKKFLEAQAKKDQSLQKKSNEKN